MNEPNLSYAPGSRERTSIKEKLKELAGSPVEIPLLIGGREVFTGNTGSVVMPHRHSQRLATYHKAGRREVEDALRDRKSTRLNSSH